MRTTTFFLVSLLASSNALAAIEPQGPPEAEVEVEAAPEKAPVLTKPPELLRASEAAYPPELFARGQAGEAILLIDIDATGKVEDVTVSSATDKAFAEAALTAARELVFTPAEIDGVPAKIRIEYRYAFEPPPPEPPKEEPAAKPLSISGLLREAGNRNPIPSAIIEVDGVVASKTGPDGRFELFGLKGGEHEVRATSPGYRPYTLRVEAKEGEVLELKLYLVRQSGDPFETVVRTRAERHEVARIQLERKEVSRLPGTFGDPVRVIENLPGLARVPGGLGGALLVRGTPPEDSAVYIDGVEVPLLYHFGGLTSVINAEFLESIDFFPGGFGARYGRATAGVVDVKSRDLDCDKLRGVGSISLLQSEAYLCAPVGEWKLALAGRRSYIDILLPPVLDRIPREPGEGRFTVSPVYWDYQAKAERPLGDHLLDVFAFGANDRLRVILTGSAEEVDLSFGLHLASHRLRLRDRWRINERATLTSQLTPGFERQGFIQTADSGGGSGSNIDIDIYNLEWREELAIALAPNLDINLGLDHNFGVGIVGFSFPIVTELRTFPSSVFDYTRTREYESKPKGYNQAYFAEAIYSPIPAAKLTAGLRLDRFDFEETQGLALQPRVAARFELWPKTTVKAAYGIYAKLPELEYLIPDIGNPDLLPERAQHFIFGVERKLTELIDLDVQGYYNLREDLRSPTPEVRYENGRATPLYFDSAGSGRSYGIEVLLRHLATAGGNFYGWIAYTLSRSLQRDRREPVETALGETETGINDPTLEYLVAFDQTHILTVVGQWKLPWEIEAGFRFRLTSGNPFSPLDEGTVSFDVDADRYRVDTTNVARGSRRMPTFNQLDVRIDKTFTFDLWKLTPYLEVLNAYNASNVEGYTYDYRFRQRNELSLLPIIPVIGVRGEF